MNRGSPIVACHLVVAILVGFVLATASPESRRQQRHCVKSSLHQS